MNGNSHKGEDIGQAILISQQDRLMSCSLKTLPEWGFSDAPLRVVCGFLSLTSLAALLRGSAGNPPPYHFQKQKRLLSVSHVSMHETLQVTPRFPAHGTHQSVGAGGTAGRCYRCRWRTVAAAQGCLPGPVPPAPPGTVSSPESQQHPHRLHPQRSHLPGCRNTTLETST